MKRAIIVIVSLVLLVESFWLVAIPERYILSLMETAFSGAGLHLRTEGFRKGLFFNFSARKMVLSKMGTLERSGEASNPLAGSAFPLVIFQDVSGRVDLPSVLKANPRLGIDCSLHGGEVKGVIGLTDNSATEISGHGLQVRDIPFLGRIGIRGEGNLSGHLSFDKGEGEATFAIEETKLGGLSFGAVILPLNLFQNIRGAFRIKEGIAEVRSFTMEGDGVYARLKGRITQGGLDMTVELMTDASFRSETVFRQVLEQYEVSPGYYVMPLKAPLRL